MGQQASPGLPALSTFAYKPRATAMLIPDKELSQNELSGGGIDNVFGLQTLVNKDGGNDKSQPFPNAASCHDLRQDQLPPTYPHLHRSKSLINNSHNVYMPVRLICGVTIMCRPKVLIRCPQILDDLETDLKDCFRILPRSVHSLMRRTRIWVNRSYCYGLEASPVKLDHSTAHHHEGWLLWAGDRPDKTLGIEIYNCFEFRRMRLHWNGCGLLMHEFCHLIHQLVLPQGLENEQVKRAFLTAQKSGLYQRILRRDWAGRDEEYDMAYALVDWKEFFAEMSVTYFSHGYRDLENTDKNLMHQCCPPICEPTVLGRLRQKYDSSGSVAPKRLMSETNDSSNCFQPFACLEKLLRPGPALSHCNKFYPFTRSQLSEHDPDTFYAMETLWAIITAWEDPLLAGCCWTPWRHRQPTANISDVVIL